MLLKRFYDTQLAQASYLVGCQATGDAIIIDPNRDVAQYLAAVKAEATLGEVSDALREVFGEYRETVVL